MVGCGLMMSEVVRRTEVIGQWWSCDGLVCDLLMMVRGDHRSNDG